MSKEEKANGEVTETEEILEQSVEAVNTEATLDQNEDSDDEATDTEETPEQNGNSDTVPDTVEEAVAIDWDRFFKGLETDPYVVSILSWALNRDYRKNFTFEDLKEFIANTPEEEIRKYYHVEASNYEPSYGFRGSIPDRLITTFFPFGEDTDAHSFVIENSMDDDKLDTRIKRQFFYLSVGIVLQRTSSANPVPENEAKEESTETDLKKIAEGAMNEQKAAFAEKTKDEVEDKETENVPAPETEVETEVEAKETETASDTGTDIEAEVKTKEAGNASNVESTAKSENEEDQEEPKKKIDYLGTYEVLHPTTSISVFADPADKRKNCMFTWPEDGSAQLIGRKYKGYEETLETYKDFLELITMFLGDPNDEILEIHEGDSDDLIAYKILMKFFDILVDRGIPEKDRALILHNDYGIPLNDENEIKDEALKEGDKVYAIEEFYQKREANYEKRLNEKDMELNEKDEELKDKNFEIVYFWLTNNKSLDEALNHTKIPNDEREEFVNELIVKYPDAKNYLP